MHAGTCGGQRGPPCACVRARACVRVRVRVRARVCECARYSVPQGLAGVRGRVPGTRSRVPEILQRDSARTVLCALTVFVQTIYPSHALLVAVVLCGCCGDQDSAGGRRRACGRACARVSSASRAFHARPGRAHARPRQGLDIGTGARPPQHEPPHLVDLAVVDKLLDEELAFILRKGIWEKGHAVVGERCGQPRSVCRSGAGPVGRRAERGVRGGCLHGARPGTALTAGARTRWGTCALAGGAAGYGDEGERQPDAVRAAHRRPSCFFFFLRNVKRNLFASGKFWRLIFRGG